MKFKIPIPKIIKITNNFGEIENGSSCIHHFNGGKLSKANSLSQNIFSVKINVIDEKTNSILKVNKDFESKKSALKYLKIFISKYPVCEAIIFKNTKKELYHYV